MRGRFLHGVASGDPLPDAIILWTRLTPIEQTSEVPVQWQIWEGNKLLLSGQEKAKETQDFTVKVDVQSQLFQPSVLYRYRFDAGDAKSPLGQFRLPPAPSQPQHRLDYAIFSCANRGFGNFRAYSEALDRSPEGLDFWLHLGDYIYEYGQQKYPNPSETRVPGLQPPNDLVHLQDYRQRHAYYRLDADLQRLSAAAPLISIWDDHEVANDDFVDGAENHRSDQGSFEERKRAAIRAYHEWLPTRPNFDPSNTSAVPWMRWRRFDFGGLATLLMLETRLWARTSQAEMTTESVHNEIGGVLDGFLGVSPYAWPGGEIEQGLTKVRSKVEAHRTLPQKRMLGEEQLSWISKQVKEVKEGQKWLLVGQAQVVQDLMSPNFFQAITEKEQGDPDTAKYWAAVLHNVTKLGFPYQDFQAKKNLTTTREIKNPFLLDLAAGRFGIQLNFDSWTGYVAEQRRLIEVLGRAVPTPIVYGGDSHNAWAGLLRDGDGKAVALDFDGMAVTSPGVERARPFIPPDFEAAATWQNMSNMSRKLPPETPSDKGDSESYDWSGRSSQTMRVEASRTDGPSGEHSEDESAMPSLHNPFDDETTGDDASGNRISEPLWLCSECMSPDWRIMPGGYRCGRCGCMSFFDARTERPPVAPVQNHADKPDEKPAGRHTRKPDDPEPSSSDMPDERAESEPRTSDPSIDPETLKPLSRRQRRAARKSAGNIDRRAQSNVATTSLSQKQLTNMPTQTSQGMTSRHSGHSDWRDEMLKGLNSAVNRDKDKEWSLRKGPSPGITYRGGSPPNPPQWSYHRDDLRAFQKWERKIEVWTIQVSAYLPPNEAAMLLYVSLKGEAEEELEWCDIKKINADDGVQYIVNTLRQPLMTRSVYLKRKYLHEYEYVQRQSNEPIRSFCNKSIFPATGVPQSIWCSSSMC
eukprot:symbB.v1.2.012742.t1/scaffold878.1/size155624/13